MVISRANFEEDSLQSLNVKLQYGNEPKNVILESSTARSEVNWDSIVSDEDMQGFNHIEHPENVALSLSVCESLGIPRSTALEGMRKAQPDPGALRIWHLEKDGKAFSIVNAFAANDPQSTQTIWHMVKSHPSLNYSRVCTFLNTRADRVSRTSQLLDLIMDDIKPDSCFIRGDRLERFAKTHLDSFSGHVETFDECELASAFVEKLLSQPGDTMIFGIGNIVGSGFQILDELKKYRVYR